MKYGLMYYKNTDNIGDDIQTYVAKKFLPHIDYFIDREDLNCFIPNEKEYVSVIMNGWFLHNKLAWPPSPYINPLLISMHFTSLESIDVGEKYLESLGGEYLKKYEKIGCRDIETQNRLSRHGINNYLSGCMTLTLNKFENVDKENDIVIVDIPKEISAKIEENTNKKIKYYTHFCNADEIKNKSIEERMSFVETLLKEYQKASLVITSRLHVALPSIALGTPVVLIVKDDYERDRLGTFVNLASRFYHESEFNKLNENEIKNIISNPVNNNDEYIDIRENLKRKIEDFIDKCENIELDINDLPDIDEYYNYTRKIHWYKSLHEDLRQKAKKNAYIYNEEMYRLNKEISSLVELVEDLKKSKICLENELKTIRSELNQKSRDYESIKEENQRIYKSKAWRLAEKYRKIIRKLIKDRKAN